MAIGPTRSQTSASGALLMISWAHFRPGRFQALEAEVAVTVCAAVASVSDA
jgi:hypothetical protein